MLLQTFFNYSKHPGDLMADHVAKLEGLNRRLEALGQKLADKI